MVPEANSPPDIPSRLSSLNVTSDHTYLLSSVDDHLSYSFPTQDAMSTDPYHAVEQEVQTTLQTAAQLRSSYRRIQSTARDDSEELAWALNELKATLATLEADLEDLDESVKYVKPSVLRRDNSLNNATGLWNQLMHECLGSTMPKCNDGGGMLAMCGRKSSGSKGGLASPRPEREIGEADDHQEAWAREEQQLIMQEQDRTMDTIAGTLHTLAQQAGLMGQEIVEHNESVHRFTLPSAE
ncbi:hypothetical protein DXG03_007931 [Asterophora parasitica]|uniref:Syntaxin 6/10/61 N-terminal domain-containing protein n=1 Tax=Asterophora parasitica TaxID=117018 RepID=A0A9P7G710_9AGAR|nr:hypothetical protein DXG03_007931 [Asterophora parasitica]